MKDDHVTGRQYTAAVFAALLSPMVRVLPRLPALAAGRWAWLCVLPAVPVLFAMGLLMRTLRGSMGPGEGAAALFLRVFGPIIGRLLLAAYAAWMLFYAGFVLRSGAERLAAAVYPHSGIAIFIISLLTAAALASLGSLRAMARTGLVLRGALLAVLGAVFLLSLPHIERDFLLPLPRTGAVECLAGTASVLTVGGAACLFSFLRGYVPREENRADGLIPGLILFSCAAALLCLTAVGVFGAALTTRLSYPFFTMVRDLSLSGRAQRFEAAVVALWIFADYVMCSLLLRCSHEALRTVLRLPPPERAESSLLCLRGGRWLLWVEAAAAGLCAFLLPSDAAAFRRLAENTLPVVMDVFVFGGFPLLWLAGRVRKIFPGK